LRVEIDLIRARLRAPFVSASGTVEVRELVLLRLEDADGHVGFGEAAPLESYDGVRAEDVHAALEACRATLMRAARLERAEILAECTRIAALPPAIAAIDLALWDLAGRRTGEPAWRLLGAVESEPVEVNHTIASTDRSGAAAEALKARRDGFGCVKVKVAIGDDLARVEAVRATAGPEMSIRLDANGAWSVTEATAALRSLEPAGIELCEEPVRGVEAVAELSALTSLPVSIDETAADPRALERRVCEALCLKIARCWGVTGSLETARRARATGYDVYLASTLDGPLGIAAALHVAAVIGPARPCGLATLPLFEGRDDPLPPRQGRIAVPAGPGLGDGLEAWYRARMRASG
jgi:L-alanine-DL-glutamate epimerase-like enolase superfamily enzyme